MNVRGNASERPPATHPSPRRGHRTNLEAWQSAEALRPLLELVLIQGKVHEVGQSLHDLTMTGRRENEGKGVVIDPEIRKRRVAVITPAEHGHKVSPAESPPHT